ncbi:hypothetical protein A2686_03875 [Candidatus Woesebacteria bacterium RIFCSPHIGHO2_01_FULL_38_10]|uniref:Ribbon-helix-helix protein CopG domain-containing protein n=1 Tax=Candidatus Woesebacteria bacterium RIFCSPLOWO2_01_FULL_39_10b TaxID=1802517 RepID=A0A1F8B7F7_9BACT|nr:MAG: hypothetical protein A2686_03875 [Candidatus Woesebacteria bacterium RIFCSPHIGHO2_01_FULL_38_10]OGM59986.1 MAG: hypothetical protein A2892_03755 [Candidatus Woesebacteria bacterium RIFCSPLOWO2_01_FULL_39_10b]
MIRTQVYLPDDLYRELKLLAASGKDKFSDLIREGVKDVVKKRKRRVKKFDPWKDFIGAIKGGPKISGQDLIDDYYKNGVV